MKNVAGQSLILCRPDGTPTGGVVMPVALYDKLVAVVEAARAIPEKPTPVHHLRTPGWDALASALAALEAD